MPLKWGRKALFGRKIGMKRHYMTVSLLCLIVSLLCSEDHARAEENLQKLMEDWVIPVEGTITDKFGTRNGKHKGIDIGANIGADVRVVDNGVVSKSYYSDTYGHVVFVKHPSGIETVYAHLHERLVASGDDVNKGEVIGTVGSTGVSTGPHLHFEAHVGEWTYSKENAFDPLFAFDNSFDEGIEVANQAKVVIVKQGDTLWGISQQFGVTVERIQQWNGLSTTTIYPNQEIIIYT